jgi:pSer/pThr/pTyr-binding forkhead associated (FHA) protein
VNGNPQDPSLADQEPPTREQERTLHLERSALDASSGPPVTALPADAPGATVVARSGPDAGASFALRSSPLYVGRAPDNGVVVSDPATSRRHARFEQRGQDFLVVDLGSSNGTIVDGVRVVEQVLANGAVITMGQNEFVVTLSARERGSD